MKTVGSILVLLVACFIASTESIPLDRQNADVSNSTSAKAPSLSPLTGAGNETASIDAKATLGESVTSPAGNSTKDDKAEDEKLTGAVPRPKCYNKKCVKGDLPACCAGTVCTAADWEGKGQYRCLPKAPACYKPGQQSVGSTFVKGPFYPISTAYLSEEYVAYAPCCDKREAVSMPGKKGKYCPGVAATNQSGPEASIEPSSEDSGDRGAPGADADPAPSTAPDAQATQK